MSLRVANRRYPRGHRSRPPPRQSVTEVGVTRQVTGAAITTVPPGMPGNKASRADCSAQRLDHIRAGRYRTLVSHPEAAVTATPPSPGKAQSSVRQNLVALRTFGNWGRQGAFRTSNQAHNREKNKVSWQVPPRKGRPLLRRTLAIGMPLLRLPTGKEKRTLAEEAAADFESSLAEYLPDFLELALLLESYKKNPRPKEVVIAQRLAKLRTRMTHSDRATEIFDRVTKRVA